MRCSICGIQIDSLEEAVEEGWTPYFYDLEREYELACPSCTKTLLKEGQDGEMEVKEQYRENNLRYLMSNMSRFNSKRNQRRWPSEYLWDFHG
jgi:hypothetical protein